MLNRGLWFWNAVLVAVGAADPVDVVGAFGAGEGGVHLLDVYPAVGHLRVAGFAGCCGVLAVAGMTGETTDALVNAYGSAVVAGTELRAVVIDRCDGISLRLARRVALVAEGLALVGADLYGARAVGELWKREQANREVHLLAAVKDCERICCGRRGGRDARRGLGLRRSFAVHLVAGHAGHRGLVREVGARDVPRAGGVLRLHEIAHGSVKVHAMAAQAVVHEAAISVVRGIGEDLCVGGAMRACLPGSVFVLMAFLAACGHREHVAVAQANCFRRIATEVNADMPQLGGEAGFVAIHACGGAVDRRVNSAGVCGHLMATGAALSALRGVVVGSAVDEGDRQCRNNGNSQGSKFDESHHERKAVPFQLRTNAAEA